MRLLNLVRLCSILRSLVEKKFSNPSETSALRRCDVSAFGTSEQITLQCPGMARRSSSTGRLRMETISRIVLASPALRPFVETHLLFRAQMCCHFLIGHPTRLDEQAAIGCFMG